MSTVEPTEEVATAAHQAAWDLYDAGDTKRLSFNAGKAIAAAIYASLGLKEERCCEGAEADREDFGKYSVYTCADNGQACRTRLVSKWSTP